MKIHHLSPLILFILFLFGLSACHAGNASGPAMVVSVAPDGRWAISSHRDGTIMLWDIAHKTAREIATQGNIYSAYFIKDSRRFLWQGQDGIVHVGTVDGKVIAQFKHFPVYGQLMDKTGKTYLSVDKDYGVYAGQGKTQKQVKAPGGAFAGYGKLPNLSLSSNGRYFLTAGFGSPYDGEWQTLKEEKPKGYKNLIGVTLWNTHTLQPVAKLPGNIAKTYATFSPDGRYVVSADEDHHLYIWNVRSKKIIIDMASLWHGRYIGDGSELKGRFDKKNWRPPGTKQDSSRHRPIFPEQQLLARSLSVQHTFYVSLPINPTPSCTASTARSRSSISPSAQNPSPPSRPTIAMPPSTLRPMLASWSWVSAMATALLCIATTTRRAP